MTETRRKLSFQISTVTHFTCYVSVKPEIIKFIFINSLFISNFFKTSFYMSNTHILMLSLHLYFFPCLIHRIANCWSILVSRVSLYCVKIIITFMYRRFNNYYRKFDCRHPYSAHSLFELIWNNRFPFMHH